MKPGRVSCLSAPSIPCDRPRHRRSGAALQQYVQFPPFHFVRKLRLCEKSSADGGSRKKCALSFTCILAILQKAASTAISYKVWSIRQTTQMSPSGWALAGHWCAFRPPSRHTCSHSSQRVNIRCRSMSLIPACSCGDAKAVTKSKS